MPDISYRITDVRPVPTIDPQRAGQMDMLLSWLEDGVRPYTLRMRQDEYTPDAAVKRVEEEVRKHAQVIGREGKIGA